MKQLTRGEKHGTVQVGARICSACQFEADKAADGPRYKALGNSMAVPTLKWILDRIQILHEYRKKLESADA